MFTVDKVSCIIALLQALIPTIAAAQKMPKCFGSNCLAMSKIRHGTRCGAHDSIELDVQNVSDSQYLRGYVVFNTPTGPLRVSTGLLKPGQKGNVYTCHASGEPSAIANTGDDQGHLPYPDGSDRKPADLKYIQPPRW